MATVTFPPAVGGDGSTVTDDANPSTGLANGGHRTRFVPSLAQVVAVAGSAVAAAQAANNAPGTNGTSTTSVAIGLGAKSCTMQTGRSIVVGMQIIIANTASPSTQSMRGVCTGYNSGTGVLDVLVDYIVGTGTVATWTISLTGVAIIPATPVGSILFSQSLFGVL